MEYYGYAGRILYVDLTSGHIKKEALDPKMIEEFIGGWGFNYALLSEFLKPNTDPLSPDNPIVIGVGPLCGTLTPGSGKVAITMKLPLIGSESEDIYRVATAVGGTRRFGAMLKNAGYDNVVITGRAASPSYLKIIDDDVEICDATDLWEKDLFETTDRLIKRHSGTTGACGVWGVGPAANKLVRWAHAFVDKGNSLGRAGGGAVLGSKNLKAVVTLGTKGIKVAHPETFMAMAIAKRKQILAHPMLHKPYMPAGGGTITEEYPANLLEDTRVARNACICCFSPEFGTHIVRKGRFEGDFFTTTIFSTVRDFGRRLRLKEYGEAFKLTDLLNRAGLCCLTFFRMAYFVTRLYERGVISKEDTGGVELKVGNFDSYVKLLDKIINREDIGDVMANGWVALYNKFGVNPGQDFKDGAGIVKGLDVLRECRFSSLAPNRLANTVRPKGHHVHQACHWPRGADLYRDTYWPTRERSFYDVMRDCQETMVVTDAEMGRIFTDRDFNIGRLEKHAEDAYSVYNAMSVCDISPYGCWDPMRNVPLVTEFYNAVTGLERTPRELKKKGERIWNLEKLLNVREGFDRKDDIFPSTDIQNICTPIKFRTGERYLLDWLGRRVAEKDFEKYLIDYYDERGWDIKKGIPTEEKLRELGLEKFIPIIQGLLGDSK